MRMTYLVSYICESGAKKQKVCEGWLEVEHFTDILKRRIQKGRCQYYTVRLLAYEDT